MHKAFGFGPTWNDFFFSSNLLVEAVNQEVSYSQSCSKIKVRMESRAEMRNWGRKFGVERPSQSLFLWMKCGSWWRKHLDPLPSPEHMDGLPARRRNQQCLCGIRGSPAAWEQSRVLWWVGVTQETSCTHRGAGATLQCSWGRVLTPHCCCCKCSIVWEGRGKKNRREKKKGRVFCQEAAVSSAECEFGQGGAERCLRAAQLGRAAAWLWGLGASLCLGREEPVGEPAVVPGCCWGAWERLVLQVGNAGHSFPLQR